MAHWLSKNNADIARPFSHANGGPVPRFRAERMNATDMPVRDFFPKQNGAVDTVADLHTVSFTPQTAALEGRTNRVPG